MADKKKRAIKDLKEKSGSSEETLKDLVKKVQLLAKYVVFDGDIEKDLPLLREEIKKIRDEVQKK